MPLILPLQALVNTLTTSSLQTLESYNLVTLKPLSSRPKNPNSSNISSYDSCSIPVINPLASSQARPSQSRAASPQPHLHSAPSAPPSSRPRFAAALGGRTGRGALCDSLRQFAAACAALGGSAWGTWGGAGEPGAMAAGTGPETGTGTATGMGVRALPASPNWYSSRCSDASSDGRLFGFAARHRVCLLDVTAAAAPTFYGTATTSPGPLAVRGAAGPPRHREPREGTGEAGILGCGRFGKAAGAPCRFLGVTISRCGGRGAHRTHGQDLRVRLLPLPRAEQPLRQQLGRRERQSLGQRDSVAGAGVQPAPGGTLRGFGGRTQSTLRLLCPKVNFRPGGIKRCTLLAGSLFLACSAVPSL